MIWRVINTIILCVPKERITCLSLNSSYVYYSHILFVKMLLFLIIHTGWLCVCNTYMYLIYDFFHTKELEIKKSAATMLSMSKENIHELFILDTSSLLGIFFSSEYLLLACNLSFNFYLLINNLILI